MSVCTGTHDLAHTPHLAGAAGRRGGLWACRVTPHRHRQRCVGAIAPSGQTPHATCAPRLTEVPLRHPSKRTLTGGGACVDVNTCSPNLWAHQSPCLPIWGPRSLALCPVSWVRGVRTSAILSQVSGSMNISNPTRGALRTSHKLC